MPSDVLELRSTALVQGMPEKPETPAAPTSGSETDPRRLSVLLEDPLIAIWATETARKYAISSLHALELLADALVRASATKID
jgi:hypothetical protein